MQWLNQQRRFHYLTICKFASTDGFLQFVEYYYIRSRTHLHLSLRFQHPTEVCRIHNRVLVYQIFKCVLYLGMAVAEYVQRVNQPMWSLQEFRISCPSGDTYDGPCAVELNFAGMNSAQKLATGRACGLDWPCADGCEQDFSGACAFCLIGIIGAMAPLFTQVPNFGMEYHSAYAWFFAYIWFCSHWEK